MSAKDDDDELDDLDAQLADLDTDFDLWSSFRSRKSLETSNPLEDDDKNDELKRNDSGEAPTGLFCSALSPFGSPTPPRRERAKTVEVNDLEKWKARLERTEVFSSRYKLTPDEEDELQDLIKFLGMNNRSFFAKEDPQWKELSSHSNIILKRGPILCSGEERELILLTHGLVLAKVLKPKGFFKQMLIPRTYEQCCVYDSVEYIRSVPVYKEVEADEGEDDEETEEVTEEEEEEETKGKEEEKEQEEEKEATESDQDSAGSVEKQDDASHDDESADSDSVGEDKEDGEEVKPEEHVDLDIQEEKKEEVLEGEREKEGEVEQDSLEEQAVEEHVVVEKEEKEMNDKKVVMDKEEGVDDKVREVDGKEGVDDKEETGDDKKAVVEKEEEYVEKNDSGSQDEPAQEEENDAAVVEHDAPPPKEVHKEPVIQELYCFVIKTDTDEFEMETDTLFHKEAWLEAWERVLVETRSRSKKARNRERGWQHAILQTSLHAAAVTGLDELLRDEWLDTINDLDTYNSLSPLHYATMVNHMHIMDYLLSKGADPEVEDSDGRTAMYYAQRDGLYGAQTLLQEYGAKRSALSDMEERGELFKGAHQHEQEKAAEAASKAKAKENAPADRMNAQHNAAMDARGTMAENMNDLKIRGQKINDLADKTAQMSEGIATYGELAKQLKGKTKKKSKWFGRR